jgi:hypothetical protein
MRITVGGFLFVLCFLLVDCSEAKRPAAGDSARMARIPNLVLWAWERPEDLRFIKSRDVGVAFLAKTIFLRGNRVIEKPRLQPLRVNPGTPLIGVVRIESRANDSINLDSSSCEEAVADIVQLVELQGLSALQIDFDARTSERVFYRGILEGVRRKLPDSMGLSITALASWCLGDQWLESLPIDEAVPMLFRMGVDRERVMRRVLSGADFEPQVCKGSLGVSMDEFPNTIPSGKRLYVFNPQSWSIDNYAFLSEKVSLQ